MLDGLLGRGFSSKCKSSIKLTKARLDVIKRRRNAMQKFLKKDIADLLENRLGINAYGRAGGLLVELNLSSCYDSVEQFCGCIQGHLSVMQKQGECPEECRDAVSSLMFAAARFADLPDLRDLRQIFTERYGNSLESFVDQEFVGKLVSKPPAMDKKLQLMRDIAQEFSIKWDSKAFEQELSKPPASALGQPRSHASLHGPHNDGNKQHNSRDDTALKKDTHGRWELTDDEHKLHKGREETLVKRDNNQYISSRGRRELTDVGEETNLERDNQDVVLRGKWEFADDGSRHQNEREEIVHKRNNEDSSSRGRREFTESHGRPEFTDDRVKSQNTKDDNVTKRNIHGDLCHRRKKYFDDEYRLDNSRDDNTQRRDNQDISSIGRHEYASGYTTKQKVKMHHNGPPKHTDLAEIVTEEAESMKQHCNNVMIPPYVKPNGGKYGTTYATLHRNVASADPPVQNRDITNDERQVVRPARESNYGDVNGHHNHEDVLVGDEKPKPRSVRRRHLKPPPGHDYILHPHFGGDEVVDRNLSGRRKEDARRGLQHDLHDDHDEEEDMMDQLLIHYSTKPSKFEPIRERDVADAGVSQRHGSRGSELVPPPARAVSLPAEPVNPDEAGRGPARATSFQPEMLNPAGHVHPKLPDYEDLAARFASLRGR